MLSPQAATATSSAEAENGDPVKSSTSENEHEDFFDSTLFRWISVFLYLGGISSLGFVLSLYYLLFFDSSIPEIHLRFPISINGVPLQKLQEITD
ncbi:uncharacterized protein LOC106089661 [Stomoxys calcitrans]|uniref:uncharacterized protein LOC106089661 n=1 Tax=Stomoxys calcitrans TaxID=35570 RepID=UPI0027E22EA6|nr:uncharacterized protein LOC106089661 [Stomoxys calcitrans]